MLECIETMLRFLVVLPPYHVNSFSNLSGRLLNALGGLCAQDREGRLWEAPLQSKVQIRRLQFPLLPFNLSFSLSFSLAVFLLPHSIELG